MFGDDGNDDDGKRGLGGYFMTIFYLYQMVKWDDLFWFFGTAAGPSSTFESGS